jgi:hypothetical protein
MRDQDYMTIIAALTRRIVTLGDYTRSSVTDMPQVLLTEDELTDAPRVEVFVTHESWGIPVTVRQVAEPNHRPPVRVHAYVGQDGLLAVDAVPPEES